MVWSLSPLLGFFLAPLMGSLSDRCTLSWGRRRPLILILSMFILTGLILVPWGKNIGVLFGDAAVVRNVTADLINAALTDAADIAKIANITSAAEATGFEATINDVPFYKWAVIITILGTISLDFSADTCQTPARTYMLDTCVSEDHARGLSIFTVLAGLGGFMGYSLGGINWEATAFGHFIGGNIKTVFSIVTILFLISAVITLTSFREIPLKLMEADELLRPLSRMAVKKELAKNNNAVFVINEVSKSLPISLALHMIYTYASALLYL